MVPQENKKVWIWQSKYKKQYFKISVYFSNKWKGPRLMVYHQVIDAIENMKKYNIVILS